MVFISVLSRWRWRRRLRHAQLVGEGCHGVSGLLLFKISRGWQKNKFHSTFFEKPDAASNVRSPALFKVGGGEISYNALDTSLHDSASTVHAREVRDDQSRAVKGCADTRRIGDGIEFSV